MGIETWTEERIERLTKLWAGGFSAAQIAADIGGVSRNAVIGKIHRLRLADPEYKKRPKPEPKAKKPKRERKRQGDHHAVYKIVAGGQGSTRVIRSSASAEIIKLRCVEIVPRHLSLIDLEPNDCRYPYGDTAFTYCGHPKQKSSSYCTPHFELTLGAARIMSDEERARRRISATRANIASILVASDVA